jgi:hypothetical protein
VYGNQDSIANTTSNKEFTMTSSSSLYGTPPNQDVSSTNSTSLYGGADTPIPNSDGNIVVRGDLIVLSGNILTTATTGNIFPANATTINLGNAATTINIGAGTGTTTINNNLVAQSADFGNITIAVADDQTITTTAGELRLGSTSGAVKLTGVDTLYTDTTGTFNVLNQPTTVYAFRAATTLLLGEDSGTTEIRNNLQVDGTTVGLAQATDILYSEANNRLNRPNIQSTTGNTSGLRIIAPNATASAVSTLSAISTNDQDNNNFIAIQARGSVNPLRIQTGEFVGGVQGASNESVSFVDFSNVYATVNPAGPTIGTDLTTKTYVDGLIPSITSYTIDASTTTGGANFNLVGSDATTDTIKFAEGTGVTVTRTDANTITTSIGQAVAVTDAVAFASVTTPTLNSGGASPLTITGGAVDPSIITVDGGQTTIDLNGGLGADDAQLLLSSGYMQWIHTAAGMGSVSGTWGLNADGTTSFPSYTFPFADGSANQVLKTNGSGVLAWYSPADLNTTYTIDASATTGGANLNLVGSDASTDTIKFSGSGATTVAQTSANEITISSVDTNTTYTQDASTTTGGANVNLVGSDATTDTIKYAGAGSVTVVATDASTVTITGTDTNTTYTVDASATTGGANLNLVGSDATTDTVKFSGSGATTVAQTSANEITISSVDTNTTYTQDVSTTTGGANLNLVGSDATTDSVKFAGGTNVTVVATDASTMTINATDTNTTYDFAATSTTGGANLNLTGSDATTDTVKISNGTGVSVTQISGTEVSVAIGQAVDTGASPSFAGVSAGNLTVGVATDNTIASTDTNGDIVLTPNGTGEVIFGSLISRALGEIQATTNLSYVFPAQTLNTITDNNGYSAASSFPAGTNGYGANAGFQSYYGDTLAGTNTAPAFSFRNANGNSVTGVTVPFTGLTSVAPSATLVNQVMGTLNFNGYGTTGFTNDTATQNQGGGITALQAVQIQGYPIENLSDSTLTLTSANVTGVTSSFRATLGSPSVTGTRGQISVTSTTLTVGMAVRVTGTLTGTATGIVSGQNYYIIVTNGTTTATLSATPNGSPIVTTAGTLTGLTLTRCGITFTMTGLTNVPFGRGALVTVSGVTNVTDGTYPVYGNPSTTALTMGIPHAVAPTVGGSQSFSCLTTYMGGGFRVRAFPAATPANFQNRLEIIDLTPTAGIVRTDTFSVRGGAYGNTGTDRLVVDSAKITAALPIKFPTYTAAAAAAVTGAVGWQISISDSPTVGGRMAFWDTTNARWSYISDNTAV